MTNETNRLRVVITRPKPGPEFSFSTRYPTRTKLCLLVPPLAIRKQFYTQVINQFLPFFLQISGGYLNAGAFLRLK